MTAERKLLFSVTLDDCKVETFSVSGAGGQHRDRTASGVRVTHVESGAVGRGVDSRSQLVNKKAAFKKMVADPRFTFWVTEERREMEGHQSAEQYAEQEINNPKHIRVEGKDPAGRWVALSETAS